MSALAAARVPGLAGRMRFGAALCRLLGVSPTAPPAVAALVPATGLLAIGNRVSTHVDPSAPPACPEVP